MDNIITDQKILRQVSEATTWNEVTKLNLMKRLKSACAQAWTSGCGLAAIQIGISLRFAWYTFGERDFFIINPKILKIIGKVKWKEDGCLSIPNNSVKIKRAYKIKYVSDGKLLTAKGLRAHIIQHEIDHMNGILNTDKKGG